MSTCFICAQDGAFVELVCAYCGEQMRLCSECSSFHEEVRASAREAWTDEHPCLTSLHATLRRMKEGLDELHVVRVLLYERHSLFEAGERLSRAIRQVEDVFSELKPLGEMQ